MANLNKNLCHMKHICVCFVHLNKNSLVDYRTQLSRSVII